MLYSEPENSIIGIFEIFGHPCPDFQGLAVPTTYITTFRMYICIMQKIPSKVIVKHWTFVIQKSRRDAFFKSLIGVGTKKTPSSIVVGHHHHSILKI